MPVFSIGNDRLPAPMHLTLPYVPCQTC